MNGLFDGMGKTLMYILLFIVFCFVTMKGCAKWIEMVEDGQMIKSEKPIKPTLELRIIDNKVDTLYVYRKQ